MILEGGITASSFLFFDQAEENPVLYDIVPVELRALVEFHKLCGVPALEAGTLRRPFVVNGAGFFFFSVEDTGSPAASFLFHFNHFLICWDDPSMNIVPDMFAFTDGIQMFYPKRAGTPQSQILHLESRAGLQTALPAPDTVRSGFLRVHAGHFTRLRHFGKKKTPFVPAKRAKGV